MRKLFMLVSMLCFVFMFTTCAFAGFEGEVSGEKWTTDSHVNVFEFEKWKQGSIIKCPSGKNHFHAVIYNYDPNHTVKEVGLLLLPVGKDLIIEGFSYIFEGEMWNYRANKDEKMYEFIGKYTIKDSVPKAPPTAPQNPRIIPMPEKEPDTNSDGMS